jgi:hypothetical protein
MKIFQTLHAYPPYVPFFEAKYKVDDLSYEEHRKALIEDRFYALHILKPCLDLTSNGFYTIWDYEKLQHKWAREKGWNETDLKKILLAQIEDFNPDVFYTFSSDSFSTEMLDKGLKDSIIRVCWAAAPGRNTEAFKNYKTRLTNYPGDIVSKDKAGFRSDLFQPAYDPEMSKYASNKNRPIDLFFYGQYVPEGFDRRNRQLEQLLEFKLDNPQFNIQLCLQYRLKEKLYVNIPLIRRYLRKVEFPPAIVWKNSETPVYGRSVYEKIGNSKIVFNAGVDFSENYKVNMRNFETLGCGAHMISDVGVYPDHFEMNQHFSTYKNMDECLIKVKELLSNNSLRESIAQEGHQLLKEEYSKEKQWHAFQKIVESL